MTSLHLEADSVLENPLSIVEEVVLGRDLPCERVSDEEFVAEMSSLWCNLKLWFVWKAECQTLMISCIFDGKVPERSRANLYPLLAMVNDALWLGHFGICAEESAISYRYSMILKSGASLTEDVMEDILSQAISECERFYPAFQSVVWGGKSVKEAMEAAIFETVGEA
ncbi:MAG: YbjN domain-containing protein [Alphaproteobacteria bacterium]|nr:YbjN domain-containing protein [Alphaproteobacteria bacterium]